MDMSNFRSELHIAQQSRRDKLRIQQDLSPNSYNLGVYANNFPHNYDTAADRSCRNGNICYDPSQFCPEMINFSANNPDAQTAPFNTLSGGPQYFNTWKTVASQSSSDWVNNQSSILIGSGNSDSSMKVMNSNIIPNSALDVKPNYVGFHEVQHSPNSDMNENSLSYQNVLQELVTSSNARTFGLEFASLRQNSEAGNGHWAARGGSELLLLPAYADQMRLKNTSMAADGCSHHWSSGEQLDFAAAPKVSERDFRVMENENENDHSHHTQALSLSLSSVPSPRVHETQVAEKDFQMRDVCGSNNNGVQDSRNWINNPSQNLTTGARCLNTQAVALTHRNPGPLGPFTGYATILRSSKFLRPAQQLLEELCCISRPKNVEICDMSDEIMEDARVSSGAVSNGEHVMKGAVVGNNSGVSSIVFDGCTDKGRDPEGTSSSSEVYRPESLQRKAKLLFMQDEVCKRYKQYHQQMTMVVSSFETVAGLSAATPYVSFALKTISKHFRSLKNAITDQIKSMRNVLGEELSSPSGGTSSCKGGDGNVSMLKFFDQSFQKQKGPGSNNLAILEGQHIWRPQRGLPERAVSILRAWLFDHFLHPYPTDTDKHMLATQTGLTRNQVSNWFINARVRVWKPMVEEIHMLETKGSDTNGKTAVEGCDDMDNNSSQSLNRLRMRAIPDKQAECSTMGRPEQETDNRPNVRMWNQEKRSRIEYHVPGGMDGSLMGMVTPSHRSGSIEMSGLGSVSLTLGLRQSAENAQQERHLRHYGGQMIRDFVG